MIPYGRQSIDETDIRAVIDTLRSDYLTTGPKVDEFERAVANYVGIDYAVAVSSGTAALHCAMYALEIEPGDEVIVPPMTFAATANCIVYQGGRPVFVDVKPDTLLLDEEKVEEKITEKTRAIIAVDYAGQPCEWDKLKEIADKHGLSLVADGCHALGARYKGRKVGSLADMTVFSFHPVKHITTGEGGMITTGNPRLAERMRSFRNHGINSDFRQREKEGSWYYEIEDLGYNYRITDIQCALGQSQLDKLPEFIRRRRRIAAKYNEAFSDVEEITPLRIKEDIEHSYHLYVVKIDFPFFGINKKEFFRSVREKGVGMNVHYIPVYFHPFYFKRFGDLEGICPSTENAYEKILSLPIYPAMIDDEIDTVVSILINTFKEFQN